MQNEEIELDIEVGGTNPIVNRKKKKALSQRPEDLEIRLTTLTADSDSDSFDEQASITLLLSKDEMIKIQAMSKIQPSSFHQVVAMTVLKEGHTTFAVRTFYFLCSFFLVIFQLGAVMGSGQGAKIGWQDNADCPEGEYTMFCPDIETLEDNLGGSRGESHEQICSPCIKLDWYVRGSVLEESCRIMHGRGSADHAYPSCLSACNATNTIWMEEEEYYNYFHTTSALDYCAILICSLVVAASIGNKVRDIATTDLVGSRIRSSNNHL